MKHMEETLSEHPKVRKIIDAKTVICICAQDSKTPPKRKLCIGLNDEKVKIYLHRVGLVTTFGGASLPETVARELFAKWINDSTTFCVKSTDCLTYVDGINENAINKPIPEEKNQKYTPMVLYKNSPFYQYCKNANIMELLGYFNDPEDCTPKFWNQLSKMGRSGAFKDNQIFSGLCEIFVEMTNRINERKGLQNIRYPEQFSNFLTILATNLALNDPSICFENMAKFKKFLNSINYDGPIAASTDNTKLEEKLRYSAGLDAILGSMLPLHETLVTSYNEIDTIIKKIQANNAIAKYIKNVSDVYEIHNQVLELAAHFKIYILSIGADGASVEIKAQKHIMQINSETKLEFNDELYEISKLPNSVLYHVDVLNMDKQDDGAAYRLFSHEFCYKVSQTLNSDSKNKELLIYLFII
ncbi:16588_t:CDS:2, partial [Gigaspora rosea]